MESAMKNKNKAYNGACCISLSPGTLTTVFAYNWTSEKYRDSLVKSEKLPKSWLVTGCFIMIGFIEKSLNANKIYLSSPSFSTSAVFPFSTLWLYLGSLIGWLRVNRGVEKAEWKLSSANQRTVHSEQRICLWHWGQRHSQSFQLLGVKFTWLFSHLILTSLYLWC